MYKRQILCEELGFFGAALAVALFLLLLLRGMSIAVRARDKFGALLTVGFVAVSYTHLSPFFCSTMSGVVSGLTNSPAL